MSRIFIKPAAGMTIPSPDHNRQPLPAEGAWVNLSIYWNRRLEDLAVTDDTKAQLAREAKAKKEPNQ